MELEAMLAHGVRIVTMVGVIIAAVQLFRQVREQRTAFEDRFAKEYRELLASIPVKAMLGERLDAAELEAALQLFYHYFDLCNEQAFLARTRRIRQRTWRFWREGIEDNLDRPAFRQAWEAIEPHTPADFSELRKLIARRRKQPDQAPSSAMASSRMHASP